MLTTTFKGLPSQATLAPLLSIKTKTACCNGYQVTCGIKPLRVLQVPNTGWHPPQYISSELSTFIQRSGVRITARLQFQLNHPFYLLLWIKCLNKQRNSSFFSDLTPNNAGSLAWKLLLNFDSKTIESLTLLKITLEGEFSQFKQNFTDCWSYIRLQALGHSFAWLGRFRRLKTLVGRTRGAGPAGARAAGGLHRLGEGDR